MIDYLFKKPKEEDQLTAAVFGVMKYLPAKSFLLFFLHKVFSDNWRYIEKGKKTPTIIEQCRYNEIANSRAHNHLKILKSSILTESSLLSGFRKSA
jgi:hypothetical protein